MPTFCALTLRLGVRLPLLCLLAACGGGANPVGDGLPLLPSRPAPSAEVARLLQQPELSEKEFLRLVELGHPRVLSARADVEAAVARRLQAGLWPNPSLFAGFEEMPGSPLRPGDAKAVLGIAFPIAIGGRIGAQVEAAERERAFVEVVADVKRFEVLTEARRALVEFAYSSRAAALEEESRKLAAEFHEVVRKRRDEKTILELELIKTAVELAAQEIDAGAAARDAERAVIRLRSWTAEREFDAARVRYALPESAPAIDAAASETQALERNPLMKAARRSTELAAALVMLARREAIPDVELTAAAGRSAGEADQETIVEFGISVPLPFFNRNQGRIAEAEAIERRAQFELEDARLTILTRVRDAAKAIERERTRVERFRTAILVQAEKAVTQAVTLYREGKVLNLDVLDAQRVLVKARRTYLEAQRDLALALVELETLTGELP
jgi:cobalt-zinc-cadmium efflux system outer membrane protein